MIGQLTPTAERCACDACQTLDKRWPLDGYQMKLIDAGAPAPVPQVVRCEPVRPSLPIDGFGLFGGRLEPSLFDLPSLLPTHAGRS